MHTLPDSECLSLFHEDRSVPWRNATLNLADESYFVVWYLFCILPHRFSYRFQSHDKTVREVLMRYSSDSGLCFTTWVGLATFCSVWLLCAVRW